MTNSILIALDFDGVTHPYFPLPELSDRENAHFYYLPRIQAALHPYDCEIVIASTWRLMRPFEEIKALFSKDMQKRIIGATPNLGRSYDGVREDEVKAFLEQRGTPNRPWVALDDYAQLYRDGCVVVCQDGFRDREETLLKEAMLDPVAYAQKYPVSPRGQKPHLKVGQ